MKLSPRAERRSGWGRIAASGRQGSGRYRANGNYKRCPPTDARQKARRSASCLRLTLTEILGPSTMPMSRLLLSPFPAAWMPMKSTRAGRYPEKLLLILGCCCVLLSAAVFFREGRKTDKPVTLAVPAATAHDKQEPPAKKREAALIGAPEAKSSPAPGAAKEQKQPAKKEKGTPAAEASSTAAPTIQETFDKGTLGQLPAGWSQWSSDRTNAFAISAEKLVSKPHGLAVHGKSNTAARAWLKEPQPADVQASVAVFLNTLIPAELLVRGSRLDSGSANYYAARVNRGLELKLVRVIKGEATTLGTVKSAAYISEKWARLTVQAKGKSVSVRIQRLDTGDYLDATGQWRAAPTWAISVTDNEIAGEGQNGVGRLASYAGSVFFDDFMAGKATDDEPAVTEIKPPPKTSPAKPTEKPRPPSSASLPAVPVMLPEIPRHYKHIRVAMLAYYGNPMGEFEDKLLRESVDLVVPNPAYLKHVHAVAPDTPQLIYTNASNLYQGLLTDWLAYADRRGVS